MAASRQQLEAQTEEQDEVRMTQPESMSFATERIGIIRRISIRFGGSKPRELERFIKFCFVGAIGAVIDLGVSNILMSFVFHVKDGDNLLVVLCGSISFTLAVISNFIWNRYWTYPDSRSRSLHSQLAQFFAVNVVGLLVRALVVGLLTSFYAGLIGEVASHHWFNLTLQTQYRLGANLAIMTALVIVMLWNFFANRYWTYGDVE
jgi:putative flippase GtrA